MLKSRQETAESAGRAPQSGTDTDRPGRTKHAASHRAVTLLLPPLPSPPPPPSQRAPLSMYGIL